MKTIIIEDEPRAARRLNNQLEKVDDTIEVQAILESISEAKAYLKKHSEIDLIFSDIELADGLSFEIYESFSSLPPIIFTTAYDQYAIKAFKNNGIDYLLKPINEEELHSALTKLKSLTRPALAPDVLQLLSQQIHSKTSNYKERFMVKVGQHYKSILTQDIHAFYSFEKATYILTKDQRNYMVDHSLEYIVDLLNPNQYFRVNRHFILSISAPFDILSWSNSRLKIELPGYTEDLIIVSRNKNQRF